MNTVQFQLPKGLISAKNAQAAQQVLTQSYASTQKSLRDVTQTLAITSNRLDSFIRIPNLATPLATLNMFKSVQTLENVRLLLTRQLLETFQPANQYFQQCRFEYAEWLHKDKKGKQVFEALKKLSQDQSERLLTLTEQKARQELPKYSFGSVDLQALRLSMLLNFCKNGLNTNFKKHPLMQQINSAFAV